MQYFSFKNKKTQRCAASKAQQVCSLIGATPGVIKVPKGAVFIGVNTSEYSSQIYHILILIIPLLYSVHLATGHDFNCLTPWYLSQICDVVGFGIIDTAEILNVYKTNLKKAMTFIQLLHCTKIGLEL